MVPIDCPQCGGSFKPRNQYIKLCSKRCANESQRVYKTRDEWAQAKRARKLRDDFNMSIDDYENLLAMQGGGCAICGGLDQTRRLNVDHDHSCCPGRISCGECTRGLLCINCNLTLGTAKDNPAILRAGIRYLAQYGAA